MALIDARGDMSLGVYAEENARHVAFPMGGIGSGMIALEGAGSFNHFSIEHEPEMYAHPDIFYAALKIDGCGPARILEGPVPDWKIFGPSRGRGTGNSTSAGSAGLPRFDTACCRARFPFMEVALHDPAVPVQVKVTGWSPFIPPCCRDSCLPLACVEYEFANCGGKDITGAFSFHTSLPFRKHGQGVLSRIRSISRGFAYGLLEGSDPGRSFAVLIDRDAAVERGFQGSWFDAKTMLWHRIDRGVGEHERLLTAEWREGCAASAFVPLAIPRGATESVRLTFLWHVPTGSLRAGPGDTRETYRPWYATEFPSIEELTAYWGLHAERLLRETRQFTQALYASDLPREILDAVGANLSILKSPTLLRQHDGRLWAWEGCCDSGGCCHGSCTHVWNYAQALAHLFPELERTFRDTEYGEGLYPDGLMSFRAPLPIRQEPQAFRAQEARSSGLSPAAADGQLGSIVRLYRDWRIAGDTDWLAALWEPAKRSMDYCIRTWDPDETGLLVEPQHNTYDIEFWGPNGMLSSLYLAALCAMCAMGEALGEDLPRYRSLSERCRRGLEEKLFNGEYFEQKIEWRGLHTVLDLQANDEQGRPVYTEDARAVMREDGPRYQYGKGCLADGVIGAWCAEAAGLGGILDATKTRSHLCAVYLHNLAKDLRTHANPQRWGYALGKEGGLLLCTWPRGGEPRIPFVYSKEVWTGIEYQAAAHLIMLGEVEKGLEIVRTCRSRFDGRLRNPFDEYECGHFYARALASYSLLQAMGGLRFDAVTGILHIAPRITGDFRCFLATATGFGLAGVRGGKPFCDIVQGALEIREILYTPRI